MKDIKATYARSVCDIKPQKKENHRKRISTGGNLIDYSGDVRTPSSDLTTTKLHINSTILVVKSRYTCMYVKYFYLNNMMDRSEYIMIQIAMILQEFVDKYNIK